MTPTIDFDDDDDFTIPNGAAAKSAPDEPATSQMHAKFRELCNKRMPRALHALKLIENLTSSNYTFTADEATKVSVALQAAVDRITRNFNDRIARKVRTPNARPDFRL